MTRGTESIIQERSLKKQESSTIEEKYMDRYEDSNQIYTANKQIPKEKQYK